MSEPNSPCGNCNGDGWTVEPVCCGLVSEFGGCCGNPDPELIQCERCEGTGRIPDPTDPHAHAGRTIP